MGTSPHACPLIWQGTNVVGHFVFLKNVLPLLVVSAKTGPANGTRVVFTSSNAHNFAPKDIINFADINLTKQSNWTRYGQSKAVVPSSA
jgi:retinol dehydrogenase 12